MTAQPLFLRLVLVSTYFLPSSTDTPTFDQKFAGNWHRIAMAKRGKEPMISAGDLRITYQPPDKVKVLRRVPDGSGCKDIVYQLKMATKQLFYYDDAGKRIYLIPERVDYNSFLILSVESEDYSAFYLLGGTRRIPPDRMWQSFKGLLPRRKFSWDDIKLLPKEEKCPLQGNKGEKICQMTPGVPPDSTILCINCERYFCIHQQLENSL